MANGDLSQEEFLSKSSIKIVAARGIKKAITECSSIKSLAMVAFVGLTAFGKMDSMACVVGLLGCIGAKEIDLTQITEIIKTRFGK